MGQARNSGRRASLDDQKSRAAGRQNTPRKKVALQEWDESRPGNKRTRQTERAAPPWVVVRCRRALLREPSFRGRVSQIQTFRAQLLSSRVDG